MIRVGVAASYNDTKINDPALTHPGCGLCGITMQNTANAAGLYQIDGNPLPNAPKWIASVNARYGIPVAGGEVYVYRRHEQACHVCGATVRTAVLAGRNLFWCPRCQRRFRSRAVG